MNRVDEWLASIGLAQYAPLFQEHAIDLSIVGDLSDADLKDVGLPLGARRKILRAAADLNAPSEASHNIKSPVPRDGGERRQLTVLFCDMVGSAALSIQLDPEDLRSIISRHHSEITRIVVEHNGFVARYMGDGVLAYFGYPHAHEDDAEQATRTALELVEAVAGLQFEAGIKLKVRVGIATGSVVVGDFPIEGSDQDLGVVGETPNLASRLQTMAEPDSVLICHNTKRLVEGRFNLQDLGPLIIKGWSNPVRAWQLQGAIDAESRFAALHRNALAPLIGREEEIELLVRRWRNAVEGHGRVFVLSGEAGIGKSHIAIALEEALRSEAHNICRFYCSAHHTNSVLHPFVNYLERAAQFERGESSEVKIAKLEAIYSDVGPGRRETVRTLASLLSITQSTDQSFAELSPVLRKEKMLSALLSLLERQALKNPLLMLFEDAHWIDPTSLELLTLLIERIPQLKMMLLITTRPEFTAPWPSHAHITTVPLTRFSKRDGAVLIARVTEGKALPDEVTAEILSRTDGVPLFVEELTKTILESGMLQQKDHGYELEHPLPSFAIPATLNASLMARLDRLAPVKEVAQIGAVVGRQFSYELLTAIAKIPKERLDEALLQLVNSELVFRRGEPPRSVYTFKHVLVRDAAYESLLKSRRAQIHALIADVFEKRFPEMIEAEPETIAHHLSEATLHERAREYWLAAGKTAAMRSANLEAISHLHRGLAALQKVQKTAASARQELDFRMVLGPCLIATQGPASAKAIETFIRSRDLCEQIGDPQEYLQVMFWLTTASVMRGELPLARDTIRVLLTKAESRSDRPALLNAKRGHAMILMFLGRLVEASAAIEDALRAFEASNESDRLAARAAGQDAGVADMALMSWMQWFLGHVDNAAILIRSAIDRAQAIGHPHSLAYASYYASVLFTLRGEYETAMIHAENCAALSEEHGFRQWRGLALAVRGINITKIRSDPISLKDVDPALEEYRTAGYQLGITALYVLLAETYLLHGMVERAGDIIDRGSVVAEENSERIFEAELLRLRARVVLANAAPESWEAARDLLCRAVDVAKEQQSASLELRAASDLVDLHRLAGKAGDGKDALQSIYDRFREGYDTIDLTRAESLLAVPS